MRMRFQCMTHGEVDEFMLNGYSVAHESPVKAHEKDFEGITFIVESPDGGDVTADNIKPERTSTENYLEKFSGWDEDIAQVVRNYYEHRRGVEEFECPENEGGLCVTTVVDEIFIPDIDNFEGSMGVYDGTLEIHEIIEYGSLEPSSLFEKIMAQAESRDINRIEFSTYSVDDFEDVLETLGFTTEVKENQGYGFQDSYEELQAEINL